jgi:cell division protein FtsQ
MRRVNPTARPRRAVQRGGTKPRRRRTRPWLEPRRLLLLGAGVTAVLTIAVSGWLWHSGWIARQVARTIAAVYQATADVGFAVDQVLVEGRNRTRAAAILDRLAVERGSPILALDPERSRDRLEALPWVRQASVERRLPHLLYIRLTEREPMAIWQLDGKLSVIDHGGEVIPGAKAKRFAELPLVVGAGAADHAAALLDMLRREPDLRPLVTAAVRVGTRRWNLRLKGDVEVRLPEQDAAEAWRQFAELERAHGLLQRDVVAIDLRLPGRLVVRTAPGTEPKGGLSKAGHNT